MLNAAAVPSVAMSTPALQELKKHGGKAISDNVRGQLINAHQQGLSYRQMAVLYGVKEDTAYRICSRRQYTTKKRMSAGRITASKLKAVCCTDPTMPSVNLIMSICRPELSNFQTAATICMGCEHETTAPKRYKSLYNPIHESLMVSECGFFHSAFSLPIHRCITRWTCCLPELWGRHF